MVAINTLLVGSLSTCLTAVLAASLPASNDAKVGYFGIVFNDATEQINAILSNGNSATDFAYLNNGEPILKSKVGTGYTRDPFLVRDVTNKKNFIIATDNSLGKAKGDSRSITIYESKGDSLLEWKAAVLSPHLANQSFGGVSAPEAIWDDKANKWLVTFSAPMYNLKVDPEKKGPAPPSQIWYVHTNDFKTFTKPFIYLKIENGGASDLTLKHIADNTWVRFFRDDSPNTLMVRGQVSNNGIWGDWKDIQTDHPFVKSNSLNGGPLIFSDNEDPKKFYVWVDDFALNYIPYESNDITKGNYKQIAAPNFIKNVKQGSISSVNQKEYDELKNAKW